MTKGFGDDSLLFKYGVEAIDKHVSVSKKLIVPTRCSQNIQCGQRSSKRRAIMVERPDEVCFFAARQDFLPTNDGGKRVPVGQTLGDRRHVGNDIAG